MFISLILHVIAYLLIIRIVCVYSAVKLAVNQSVMNITANDLSGLVTSDQLFIGNPNTLHTVGECVTNIRYADCLLEPESFVWHLNGSIINYTNSSYTLDENGRLTFTNAQESYAGLYLCIITLPGQFGSFITTVKELKLSVTETSGTMCILYLIICNDCCCPFRCCKWQYHPNVGYCTNNIHVCYHTGPSSNHWCIHTSQNGFLVLLYILFFEEQSA